MAFCVLVTGSPSFRDYPRLCKVLDALLANRLPDVVVLTAGGPGLPALAASYARARGLGFKTCHLDFERYPADPHGPREAELLRLADAAVVVWDEALWVRQLLERVRKKAIPVHVTRPPEQPQRPDPTPSRWNRWGTLPD